MSEFVSNCSMPLAIIFLIAGFFFLVKGADLFVEGSSSIAKKFHVPSIIIGLTIVAMGTSLPEAAVSVTASLANQNTLAVSNVVGSNIFNLMVVIGMCTVLTPVAVQRETLKRDFPFSVICACTRPHRTDGAGTCGRCCFPGVICDLYRIHDPLSLKGQQRRKSDGK